MTVRCCVSSRVDFEELKVVVEFIDFSTHFKREKKNEEGKGVEEEKEA